MKEKVPCPQCGKKVKGLNDHLRDAHGVVPPPADSDDTAPDWNGKCDICGQSPIVPATGMCGPCTFGEADTINGNW